jgi:hypothetical protein
LNVRPVTGVGSGNETELAEGVDGEIELREQPVRARVRRSRVVTGVFIGTSSVAARKPEASRDRNRNRVTRSREEREEISEAAGIVSRNT